jgi:molybdopterin/thiamine biosynthesis adenylyltransferase
MALANFIDKAALNASQVLKNFDRRNFERVLLSHTIEIAFDKNAVDTCEGRYSLELLTRLVSRLYPHIKFRCIEFDDVSQKQCLQDLAKSINPAIDISDRESTLVVVLGQTEVPRTSSPTFYVGSENWIVKFSTKGAVGSANYNNPFGAGVAACFASANIFRFIFKNSLPFGDIDPDFQLSLFTLSQVFQDNGPEVKEVHLQESTIVGLGAIGNGFIWALSKVRNLSGDINLIDDEEIEITNLQRYILTDQSSVGKSKVEIAKQHLSSTNLKAHSYPGDWNHFLNERANWKLDQVAVAVDSAKDRILIQGALPKKLLNAWTQQEALGISRHFDFLNSVCLVCLYLPTSKTKNRSEEIAENLGLTGEQNERFIREYLALNKPTDDALITRVAEAKGIDLELLRQYIGKPVDVFHSEVVCGGVLMKLGTESGQAINVEVPCAFESSMAGILLAAELVIDSNNLRQTIPAITKFNLLRPLSEYLLEDSLKHLSGRCICQDDTYRHVYKTKYQQPSV